MAEEDEEVATGGEVVEVVEILTAALDGSIGGGLLLDDEAELVENDGIEERLLPLSLG